MWTPSRSKLTICAMLCFDKKKYFPHVLFRLYIAVVFSPFFSKIKLYYMHRSTFKTTDERLGNICMKKILPFKTVNSDILGFFADKMLVWIECAKSCMCKMWFADVFISCVWQFHWSMSIKSLLGEHVHYMCVSSILRTICELWSPIFILVSKNFKEEWLWSCHNYPLNLFTDEECQKILAILAGTWNLKCSL